MYIHTAHSPIPRQNQKQKTRTSDVLVLLEAFKLNDGFVIKCIEYWSGTSENLLGIKFSSLVIILIRNTKL